MPAVDKQGMVFMVKHRDASSAWVNTVFNLKMGRVQCVHVLPDTLPTVITVQLPLEGKARASRWSVTAQR